MVLPQASAGPTFQANMRRGKFQALSVQQHLLAHVMFAHGRISYNSVAEINGWNKDQGGCLKAEEGSTAEKTIITTRTVYRRRYSPGTDSSGSSCTSPTDVEDVFSPLLWIVSLFLEPGSLLCQPGSFFSHSVSIKSISTRAARLKGLPKRADFQPISPGSAIIPQKVLNIARVENSMRAAGSGSPDIHLDPNPEHYTREKNIYDWRNKPVDLSNIPASLGVEELLNREPVPLDKERAEEILREMVEERVARIRQAAANDLVKGFWHINAAKT
ncbi:hypothetical protein AgCh_034043 [Apium graveolens]